MKYFLRKRRLGVGVKNLVGVLGGQVVDVVKAVFFSTGVLSLSSMLACRHIRHLR